MAMVNHKKMMIKQFGFFLLIASLLSIFSTHSIYALSIKREVYVDNQTDYNFYFTCGSAEDFLLAHSSYIIDYTALLPEDMSFWINEYSGDDDIAFTVTLEPSPDKHHIAVLHKVIIMTDEQGEIIYEVELVK